MNGLIPTLYEGQLEGEILFKNKDLKDIESYDISKNIGYVSKIQEDIFLLQYN